MKLDILTGITGPQRNHKDKSVQEFFSLCNLSKTIVKMTGRVKLSHRRGELCRLSTSSVLDHVGVIIQKATQCSSFYTSMYFTLVFSIEYLKLLLKKFILQ